MPSAKPTDSILETVRDAIGLEKDDTSFDTELLIYINAGLTDLYQAGVGNELMVGDTSTTWEEVVVNPTGSVSAKLLGSAMLYIFLKVKVYFDPPQVNTQNVMVEAMNQAIWRLAASWDEEYRATQDVKGGEVNEY